MKKVFALSVSVLLVANLLTVCANDQEKDPYMTRSFPASSVKSIEAVTSGGSLTVSGNAGSEAIVEVYASRSGWSDEKIKQALDENYTLDIRIEGDKLSAVAKQKKSITDWNRQGVSISFKITVPQQVDSKLQTSGGSIRINDISGSHNFTTSGGSLSVENASGNIVGRTSGGSITVTDSKDNIDLTTSGGSITAKDCSGKIKLATSGGSIRMSNLSGSINAATSGGSITANDVEGTLKTGTSGGSVNLDDISGNLDAHTSGGSMNVEMVSVNEYVKLSNSGNLKLILPSGKGYDLKVKANKIETSGLKDFRGNVETRSLEGTVGSGGPKINVNCSQRASLSFE
ncbi:MAG: hypothetical protein LBL24_04280 [Bacteroidales bacterium]|jgi:hypothetical protein|nr:hypothetical protein [Bacteroidales bacterium]